MQARSHEDIGIRVEAFESGEGIGGGDGDAEQGETESLGVARNLAAVRQLIGVAMHVHESPWGPDAASCGFAHHDARPPRLPASCPFCAASCMASAAETSSPSPRPEMWRRTSPAIIWPMMGGMKLAVPKSVRSERAAPGAAAMRTGSSQE